MPEVLDFPRFPDSSSIRVLDEMTNIVFGDSPDMKPVI